jgi:ABC-type transport system involved in multi-copper enzyme maturation permease subunit
MSTAVALRMTSADILKLRKKRSILIWALALALVPLIGYFIVKASLHSSTPAKDGPAGGMPAFEDGLRILGMFFGPLAAILIGVEAGAGDAASGVFRDLVVTGRSRIALFATRVPAALVVTLLVAAAGYALTLVGVFAFASNLPTPSFGLILEGAGFIALETGVLCVVALGFASLTNSRPAAIVTLIGVDLLVSPILANITSLGNIRRALLNQAILHFVPIADLHGGHGPTITMSGGTAIVVIVGWLAVFLALGAWRTRTMDA